MANSSVTVAGITMVDSVFAPGHRLAEHWHEQAFFCFATRGHFTEVSNGRVLERAHGSVVFHGPRETHADSFGSAGGACFNIEFGFAWNDRVRELLEPRAFRRQQTAEPHLLGQHCERLRVEATRADPVSHLVVEGIALLLLADFTRLCERCGAGGPKWVYVVRDYLHQHYLDLNSLSDAAHAVGVHPSHVARVFRRTFHSGLAGYVRRLRLYEARRRLVSREGTLAEIAAATGFADQSHFTRSFRKEWGVPPGYFRRLVS